MDSIDTNRDSAKRRLQPGTLHAALLDGSPELSQESGIGNAAGYF